MKRRLGLMITTFILSLILMGALSLSSVKRLNTYISYSNQMDHANDVLMRMYDVEKDLRDIDRTERGYLLTKDTLFTRLIAKSISNIWLHLDSLAYETRDNGETQKKIRLLKASVAMRIAALHKNIFDADTTVSQKTTIRYSETRNLMLECAQLLRDMHEQQMLVKVERNKEELFYEKITSSSISWLLVVFCASTCILFVLLLKEFVRRSRYQHALQAKVTDLKRSHTELQEIAYVASHDLQEPLRKIQVFSNMLQYKNATSKQDDYLSNLERISNAAHRMQSLIADLMKLTSLTKTGEIPENTDLNNMLFYIIEELNADIVNVGATVVVKLLPDLQGYPDQLRILFMELLTNALKFRRNEHRLEVTISCSVVKGNELESINADLRYKKFYRIDVTDNGIGFDGQFTSKMFQMFQCLHHPEAGYEGKGIGLAICQRVMANHDGFILSVGVLGEGATFQLFFPAEA